MNHDKYTSLMEDRTISEAYADLAGAICAQAVNDYRTAYMGKLAGHRTMDSTVATLEKFFRSEWFVWLIRGNLSGEMVISEVRKQCEASMKSKHFS